MDELGATPQPRLAVKFTDDLGYGYNSLGRLTLLSVEVGLDGHRLTNRGLDAPYTASRAVKVRASNGLLAMASPCCDTLLFETTEDRFCPNCLITVAGLPARLHGASSLEDGFSAILEAAGHDLFTATLLGSTLAVPLSNMVNWFNSIQQNGRLPGGWIHQSVWERNVNGLNVAVNKVLRSQD